MIGMRSEVSPDPRFPKQDRPFDQLIPGSVREYGFYIIPRTIKPSSYNTVRKCNKHLISAQRFYGLCFLFCFFLGGGITIFHKPRIGKCQDLIHLFSVAPLCYFKSEPACLCHCQKRIWVKVLKHK